MSDMRDALIHAFAAAHLHYQRTHEHTDRREGEGESNNKDSVNAFEPARLHMRMHRHAGYVYTPEVRT